MRTVSKLALAFVGMAGVALAAESAHAVALELNGAGSSAGRLFAGDSVVSICKSTPTPLLFTSFESVPNMYEWQCTITANGTDYANSIVRYSASASADGYLKQPNGSAGSATYLVTSGCPAGSPVTIEGKTVTKSVCPSGTATTTKTVHWGGADVQASSLHQNRGGADKISPPATGHLTTTPTVIVPFSIVVGGNVRQSGTTKLASLTREEITQILSGNVTDWTQLGYTVTVGSTTITNCQRTAGSGTLATLDETLMLPKYLAASFFPGTSNASSGNMATCINGNQNSIGYIDSDSVTAATFTNGAYQVQINGANINSGPGVGIGTGVARLKDLRCGKYPYWATWNFITRTDGLEVAPISAVAGSNDGVTALQAGMQTTNPLPDYWLDVDDSFVSKESDRGPYSWVITTTNGAHIATTCN